MTAPQENQRKNPNDRSWLVKGQRAYFLHMGDHKAGNVKEVYPEPPYSDYVKVRLDEGEEVYVPYKQIVEGMQRDSSEDGKA